MPRVGDIILLTQIQQTLLKGRPEHLHLLPNVGILHIAAISRFNIERLG
jgi:hypothetical protein